MVVESSRRKPIVDWFKYYDKNRDGKLTKEELISGDPNGQDASVQKKISSVLSWVGDLSDNDKRSLDFIGRTRFLIDQHTNKHGETKNNGDSTTQGVPLGKGGGGGGGGMEVFLNRNIKVLR